MTGHERFGGRGGTGSASSRWDIGQWRGADILSAKAANIRGTRERVGSSRGTAARTGAPATARCSDASR
jgi:hypothetical protein